MTEGESTLCVMGDATSRIREETESASYTLMAGCQILRLIDWREVRNLTQAITDLRKMERDLNEYIPAFRATHPTILKAKEALSRTAEMLAAQHDLEVPA